MHWSSMVAIGKVARRNPSKNGPAHFPFPVRLPPLGAAVAYHTPTLFVLKIPHASARPGNRAKDCAIHGLTGKQYTVRKPCKDSGWLGDHSVRHFINEGRDVAKLVGHPGRRPPSGLGGVLHVFPVQPRSLVQFPSPLTVQPRVQVDGPCERTAGVERRLSLPPFGRLTQDLGAPWCAPLRSDHVWQW